MSAFDRFVGRRKRAHIEPLGRFASDAVSAHTGELVVIGIAGGRWRVPFTSHTEPPIRAHAASAARRAVEPLALGLAKGAYRQVLAACLADNTALTFFTRSSS